LFLAGYELQVCADDFVRDAGVVGEER
jgi:hypothetical protein